MLLSTTKTRCLIAAGVAALVFSTSAVWVWADQENGQADSSVLVQDGDQAALEGPALPAPANVAPLSPPSMPSDAAAPAPADPRPAPRATRRPFLRPAEPDVPPSVQGHYMSREEPIPSPVAPSLGIEVRPAPRIKYDTDRDARRMYRASGEINIVMVTQNPADGCYYEIPLCIPACCVGEPSISGGRGLLGRGVVEYCWPCGFRAEVKFRHILGDVKVDYEGD